MHAAEEKKEKAVPEDPPEMDPAADSATKTAQAKIVIAFFKAELEQEKAEKGDQTATPRKKSPTDDLFD